MNEKPKREGPLKILYEFEDAIQRALRVKPPLGGRAEYERRVKRNRKARRSKLPT